MTNKLHDIDDLVIDPDGRVVSETEGTLHSTRRAMRDVILTLPIKMVDAYMDVILQDSYAPLGKYHSENQELIHNQLKTIFSGRIVRNVGKTEEDGSRSGGSGEYGLVCRLGFGNETDKDVNFKVLVLQHDLLSTRETTWSFNTIELIDVDSVDFIKYRYF